MPGSGKKGENKKRGLLGEGRAKMIGPVDPRGAHDGKTNPNIMSLLQWWPGLAAPKALKQGEINSGPNNSGDLAVDPSKSPVGPRQSII